MLIIFQGGESATHVDTLFSAFAMYEGEDLPPTAIGMSYKGLMDRGKGYDHIKTVSDVANVVLEGGYSTSNLSLQEAKDLEKSYYDFVFDGPHIAMAIQFDHPVLVGQQATDPRVVPLFPPDGGPRALKSLLDTTGAAALSFPGDSKISGVLRKYQSSLSISLGTPDLSAAHRAGFTAAMTSAWYAPGRFGEISLWDGNRFHRKNSTEREDLLNRYKARLEKAGFDIEELESWDSTALNRLAAWSYLKWAASLPDAFSQNLADSSEPAASESVVVSENLPGSTVAHLETPARRTGILPGFSNGEFFEDAPLDEYHPKSLLSSSGESFRQCDSCFLSANCPSFEKGAKCAYNFPVEVKTPEQIRALLGTMVEIQAGRVAFAKFAEDLNGGYPEETVGVEMDRLFKMADLMNRPVKRERLTVSVESESSGGGTGVLSAIFGKGREENVSSTQPPRVIEQLPDRTA